MATARLPSWLQLSATVRTARRSHRPIVALETAVLTHGLPANESLTMARELEEAVRKGGAAPAFIALLNGKVHVGLTAKELKTLAGNKKAEKCSRSDLGWLLAGKALGGTTVSATIYAAAQVGIQVAATGGIGGVHRDATESFDISADLMELARTPVTLVCSGAKIIVDLRKTLEFLESQSVPVIGYGTDELPGFLVRPTGLSLRPRAYDIKTLAAVVRTYRATGYRGAILVANPIPLKDALEANSVEEWVTGALREAEAQSLSGAGVTPFLLQKMNELSGGATLRANKALLRSNAELAAHLAAALSRRKQP